MLTQRKLRTPASLKASWLRSVALRYKSAREGVAAIEFAFVAPVMIMMYFGLAEISLAIALDRSVSHSANIAGDLTTQSATVSPAEMAEIMNATIMVMGIRPEKYANIKLEIASYSRDIDNTTIIDMGVATLGGTYPTAFDATNLSTAILSSTSGIVVARINYSYTPLGIKANADDKFNLFSGSFDLGETFLLKPRQSANVDIVDPGTGSRALTCSFNNQNKVTCV